MKIKLKMKIKKKPEACACKEDEQMRRISALVRIADAVIRTILSLSLVFCFVSCSSISGYSEPEDRYTVSAIGFDYEGGVLEASVQIVGKEGEENLVRVGRGENVRQAMGHIEGADSRQLEISHCALILIGDSVGKDTLFEIFDYCRKNNDITVGVKVAAAHNARELLSLEDGYELIGAIRDGKDGLGFTGGSRFYEIEEIRSSGKEGIYHLPYFSSDGEIYTVSGLKVYKGDSGIVRLDRSESVYYMMIKGELRGGVADFEIGDKWDSVYVINSKTKQRTEDERLYITCSLEVNRELMGEDAEKVENALSRSAEELCHELARRYGDIFDFGDDKEIIVECTLKKGR